MNANKPLPMPVFFQYNRPGNILDTLISIFKDRSWEFNGIDAPYFHKYYWPDIVLSDEEAEWEWKGKNDQGDYPYTFELLGCYKPTENHHEGGQVILYMRAIHRAAQAFITGKEAVEGRTLMEEERTQCIEDFTTVILIHEFVHWIVHVGKFSLKKDSDISSKPISIIYDSEDSVSFHESIAQIFNNYLCTANKDLCDIFYWLEERQPAVYQAYKNLVFGSGIAQPNKKGVLCKPDNPEFHDSVNRKDIDIVNVVVFSIMICRLNELSIQSFDTLKKIFIRVTEFTKPENPSIKDYFEDTRIECFQEWDWEKEALADFTYKYRGCIAGKPYNV